MVYGFQTGEPVAFAPGGAKVKITRPPTVVDQTVNARMKTRVASLTVTGSARKTILSFQTKKGSSSTRMAWKGTTLSMALPKDAQEIRIRIFRKMMHSREHISTQQIKELVMTSLRVETTEVTKVPTVGVLPR